MCGNRATLAFYRTCIINNTTKREKESTRLATIVVERPKGFRMDEMEWNNSQFDGAERQPERHETISHHEWPSPFVSLPDILSWFFRFGFGYGQKLSATVWHCSAIFTNCISATIFVVANFGSRTICVSKLVSAASLAAITTTIHTDTRVCYLLFNR